LGSQEIAIARLRFLKTACFLVCAIELLSCGRNGNISFNGVPDTASAFVDGFGVDAHFGESYESSPYELNYALLLRLLRSSGIRHLRNNIGSDLDAAGLLELKGIVDENISLSAMLYPNETNELELEKLPMRLDERDAIQFVEGPNELDLSGNSDWPSVITRDAARVKLIAQSAPAWHGIPVLAPSLGYARNASRVGNLSSLFDAGNVHYGPNHGLSPGLAPLQKQLQLESALSGSKPIWVTETGYITDGGPCLGRSNGAIVPDDVIAKYDPRLYALWWNLGVHHVFFYQLSDMSVSDGEFGCSGLVNDFGGPKPQFVALSAMLRLLTDSGHVFAQDRVSWKLVGDVSNVHTITLEKNDRSIWILAWIETPSFIPYLGLRIPNHHRVLQLTLSVKCQSMFEHNYDAAESLNKTVVRENGGMYPVSVGDELSFIEIDR
jgi:hypothetical protein